MKNKDKNLQLRRSAAIENKVIALFLAIKIIIRTMRSKNESIFNIKSNLSFTFIYVLLHNI